MTLSSRLDPATYTKDEPVGIAAVARQELPGPFPDQRWRYIPERLWARILNLGAAYELHFAQVFEPTIDTVVAAAQCDAVEEELRFLSAVIRDEALMSALGVILDEMAKVRGHSTMALVVSPP